MSRRQVRSGSTVSNGPSRRALHTVAIAATAALLFVVLAWTYVAHPDRLPPTRDSAYYTWKTQALISEPPASLIESAEASEVFGGGYRVATLLLGGLLRRIAGVAELDVVTFLMVSLTATTALLLAAFALRHRDDPLIFHMVAWGAVGLLLTDVFLGYLDNLLSLCLIAASLLLLDSLSESWPARLAAGLLLTAGGLAHPATMLIFYLTVGVIVLADLALHRSSVGARARATSPFLLTCAVAGALTFIVWSIGIWGVPARLSEAAVTQPYSSDFFLWRLRLRLGSLQPLLTGPLLAAGVLGVVRSASARAADDWLARISLFWLLPLLGCFGWLLSLAYPYHRFLNATLAWVLLVPLGAHFLMRWTTSKARRGGLFGLFWIASIGVVALLAFNLHAGLRRWNDPREAWVSSEKLEQLAALRAALVEHVPPTMPIVFVLDADPSYAVRDLLRDGNSLKVAIPPGRINRSHLYLGRLTSYSRGLSTSKGDPTYDRLSRALFDESHAAIGRGTGRLVVLADAFGSSTRRQMTSQVRSSALPSGWEVWFARGSKIVRWPRNEVVRAPPRDLELAGAPGPSAPRLALGLSLLLAPGVAVLPSLPRVSPATALGLAPALAAALLTASGALVLAVAGRPLSVALAALCVAVALVPGLWSLAHAARSRLRGSADRRGRASAGERAEAEGGAIE